MRGKPKRFSRVYAWAAVPTSASNGFLRPSTKDVAKAVPRFSFYITTFPALERRHARIMKKTLVFILGIVAGIVLTISVTYIYPSNKLTIFKNEGNCISDTDMYVIQVVENGHALALTNDITIVLCIAKKGRSYYDGQVIEIPKGKCAKQIGIYKYTSKFLDIEKTVPVVDILEK